MRSPLGALARAITNKTPVAYSGRSSRLSIPHRATSSTEDQLRAMETDGTLFAIVDRLATAVSEVEWTLYRTAPSGLPEDRTPVLRHAALDIWNRPNPWMPRQEFVESFQQHLELTGEAWWVVARNPAMRSIPLELWPVRPDRMMPVPHPTEFISGYIYCGPDGERVPLRVDEVIMLRRPHPRDPYRGISPVGTILPDLGASRLAAEWNRNFFRNSALPSGIIEAPTNLGDDEFNDLRDRWEEQHRGVAAAHRVAVLEGGLKWVDRKFTQADMQFIESRGATREIIREAYAMHGHTLGLSESVNRANAEAADTTFARWQVKPRCGRIKQALNFDFLPLFGAAGQGLEWDFANPVPDDREADNAERTSKAKAARDLVDAGFEPAGTLVAVGLPAIPFVGSAPRPSPALPAAPAARVPRGGRRAHLNQVEEEPREDWEDRLDALLADWGQVSEDQRAELLEQIEEAVVGAAPADLAALSASSGAAATLLEAALIAQAEAASERVVEAAEEQGVTITAAAVAGVLAADLAAAAAVTAALLAAGLAASAAREALRVWAPGMSAAEVVSRVREHLEGLSDASLRTELGGALWAAEGEGRFATLEQAEEDGNGATYFVATETRDRSTCIRCEDIDGDRFDTLAEARENYPHGGYFACLGTIRCRGTVEPVWGGS